MTGPIRVAQIVTTLARGGAQATVLASRDLSNPGNSGSDGFDITILAGPDDPGEGTHWAEVEAEVASGTVVTVPALHRAIDPIADTRALGWLVGWLRANRPQVVHTHSSKAGVLGRLAAAAAGIPVAHTVHGWSFASRRGLVARGTVGLERSLARLAGALVVVTPADRDEGLATRIGRPDQYRVIRSGVDLAAPRRGRCERGRIRAELGLGDGFVVGAVGRLAAQKDLTTLVDGFARAGIDASRLVLVGDGPQRGALEHQARSSGLGDRVVFCGQLPAAAEVVAAFDVFALTSRWEGLPRSLIEAMAAGVPVVATPVGGVEELVVPGVTGTLIPPGDPGAVAAALRDQARRPDHYRQQAARAEAGIGAFSVEQMRVDLAQLWADLAAATGPAGRARS